jgi:toxin ParE1/3/4
MRILWLDHAEADLDAAFDYVLARDPGAARRLYNAIRNRVALLADQPALGRPGRVSGTRELVIGGTPYIVAYTIDHAIDSVVILRVLHGARRWPEAL